MAEESLVGKVFGKLTVIKSTSERGDHISRYLCRCECGRELEVTTSCLTSGVTRSCGHDIKRHRVSWAELHPEIAAEWDEERNGMKAIDVPQRYSAPVWWVCANGHHSQKTILGRLASRGCAECLRLEGKSGVGDPLSTTFPDIAAELDEEQSGFSASEISALSHSMAHWKCKTCGAAFRASVYLRTQKGSVCPKCAKAMGKEHRSAKIFCVETREIFESAEAAATFVGRSTQTLRNSIARGGRCGGYTFKYLADCQATSSRAALQDAIRSVEGDSSDEYAPISESTGMSEPVPDVNPAPEEATELESEVSPAPEDVSSSKSGITSGCEQSTEVDTSVQKAPKSIQRVQEVQQFGNKTYEDACALLREVSEQRQRLEVRERDVNVHLQRLESREQALMKREQALTKREQALKSGESSVKKQGRPAKSDSTLVKKVQQSKLKVTEDARQLLILDCITGEILFKVTGKLGIKYDEENRLMAVRLESGAMVSKMVLLLPDNAIFQVDKTAP